MIGVFSYFFGIETTLEERTFFRDLAKLIGRRAARLSACGIAAIVSKKGYLEEGCAVGADGSLYNVSRSILYLCDRVMRKLTRRPGRTEIPRIRRPNSRGFGRHLWREGKVSHIRRSVSTIVPSDRSLTLSSRPIGTLSPTTPRTDRVSEAPSSLVSRVDTSRSTLSS